MSQQLTVQVLAIIDTVLDTNSNSINSIVTENRNGATVRFKYETESDLQLLNNTITHCESLNIKFDVIDKPEEKYQAWYLDFFK